MIRVDSFMFNIKELLQNNMFYSILFVYKFKNMRNYYIRISCFSTRGEL